MMRKGWANMAKLQGNQTADIVRTVVTVAGDKSKAEKDKTDPAPNLTGLRVITDRIAAIIIGKRGGSEVQLKEGERIFLFLDIPASGGVAANTIQGSDTIKHQGMIWAPVDGQCENDPINGISWARCKLVSRGG